MGISVSIISIFPGACVIEKHLILNRKLDGPDAAFSLELNEFKAMVKSVREVEKALGEVHYKLTEKMKKQRIVPFFICSKGHKSRRSFYRRKYSFHKTRIWL